MASATIQSRYRVTGMDCASCAAKIDTAVRRLPDVSDVAVSVSASTLKVEHGPGLTDEALKRQVRNLGYGVEAAVPPQKAADGSGRSARHGEEKIASASAHHDHDASGHSHDHGAPLEQGVAWWQTKKARLTATCGAALLTAYILGHFSPGSSASCFSRRLPWVSFPWRGAP